MFLPVRPDFALRRFPFLTALVCLLCVVVFLKQESDWSAFGAALEDYCETTPNRLTGMTLKRIADPYGTDGCIVMAEIAGASDGPALIGELVQSVKPLSGFSAADSRDYLTQLLQEELARYRAMVPENPNRGFTHYSDSWNPWTMLTSSFAHGDWSHIIFNLIFYAAFGTTVEMLVGVRSYIGLIVAVSLFNGFCDSLSALATGEHFYSLGLSGVVMGMIGLSAYLLPGGKIRCYFWFVIYFGSVAVPIWALALWYIGGDVYAMFAYDDHGLVNVLAHVTGGFGGYLFGVCFLRKAREDARGLQMEIDRAAFRPRFQ